MPPVFSIDQELAELDITWRKVTHPYIDLDFDILK